MKRLKPSDFDCPLAYERAKKQQHKQSRSVRVMRKERHIFQEKEDK